MHILGLVITAVGYQRQPIVTSLVATYLNNRPASPELYTGWMVPRHPANHLSGIPHHHRDGHRLLSERPSSAVHCAAQGASSARGNALLQPGAVTSSRWSARRGAADPSAQQPPGRRIALDNKHFRRAHTVTVKSDPNYRGCDAQRPGLRTQGPRRHGWDSR